MGDYALCSVALKANEYNNAPSVELRGANYIVWDFECEGKKCIIL